MTDTNTITPELNDETLANIKNDLLLKKESILKEINNIAGVEKDGDTTVMRVKFPEYGDKYDENAQEIDEYTKNLATEKVLEDSLRDINGALERIEAKTYGTCKYCQKQIPVKRLLARPVASACVECKTKLQKS